ncbi:MAG: hypothetical protein HY802_00020, partial [Methanobacterium sp.]|nr:hypothetical protein [Methanobacterium sp.]
MLDWIKIDNEKKFQQLVNHLFSLESDSPGFIPSSPYIGADGGWDGYFDGYYPPEGNEGIFSIQAKWTSKSLNEAETRLKRDIKAELKKAKRNYVKHLRIVTNAELRVEQVKNLNSLNNGEVSTLRVWHREELTRRIELQPFLRYYFFNLAQHPKFVPRNFDGKSSHKLPDLNSNNRSYLEKAEKFINEDSKNVLIIHSPGDYGKSHLLELISENVHEIDSKLQPWVVRPGFRTMEDSLQDEIITGRKYLLIFDDADRNLEEIKPLLSFCKYHKNFVKVVLACREAGLKYIYDIIKDERIEEMYDDIKISRWSKEDLIRLLKEITGKDKLEYEEIAVKYPSPALMVIMGNQIKKDPKFDFDKFEEKYVNELLDDAKRCLEDFIEISKVKDFLLNISCIIPFSEEDNNVLEIMGSEFQLSEMEIKEMIRSLKEGGVLRDVGGVVRFDPDLKGDLFLAYTFKKLPEDKIKYLINSWLPICADKVFINLEEAFTHDNIDSLKTILSEMIDNWIREVENTDGYSRIQNLNLLKDMCIIVPENCLDILNVYLNSDAPSSKDPTAKICGMENISPRTGDYEPSIRKLRNFSSLRSDLVMLIEKIASKDIDRLFSGSTSSQLIKEFVKPTKNNVNSIIKTLAIFEEWLDNPNETRIELISSALSEILLGAHHRDVLIQMKVYWWEVPQPKTREIMEMREKALMVLKKMSICASGDYLKESIEIAKIIGHSTEKESNLPIS